MSASHADLDPGSALPLPPPEEFAQAVTTPPDPSESVLETQKVLQGVHDGDVTSTGLGSDSTTMPATTPTINPTVEAATISGPLLPNGLASAEMHPGNPTFVMLHDLDEMVQEWCASDKGQQDQGSYPPCTHDSAIKSYYNKSALNHNQAVYLNLAGERLEVAVAQLQHWSPRRYIMIVWGRDGVPMIIHTKGKKGTSGVNVPYFVWKGITGDEQGFEDEPSIRKAFIHTPRVDHPAMPDPAVGAKNPIPVQSMTPVLAPLPALNNGTAKTSTAALVSHLVSEAKTRAGPSSTTAVLQPKPVQNKAAQHFKVTPQSFEKLTDEDVLLAVQHHIDEWRASSRGTEQPPFTAGVGLEDPYKSQNGTRCHYETAKGERLVAKRFDVGYGRPTILVVYGKTQPPVIVKNNKHSRGAGHNKGYSIWWGMARQFEKKPSVYKVFHEKKSTTTVSKKKEEEDFSPNAASSTLASSLKRAKSMSALSTRSSKHTKLDEVDDDTPSTHKRRSVKRVSGYAEPSSSETAASDAPSPLNNNNTTTMIQNKSQPTVPTAYLMSNAPRIYEHMQLNAYVAFISRDAAAEDPFRVRPFGKCNDVRKLFMNAKAARLFGAEASPGHRMLNVEIEGVDEPVIVLDGDDEDFEKLVEVVQAAPGWTVRGGTVQGTCSITVRADL